MRVSLQCVREKHSGARTCRLKSRLYLRFSHEAQSVVVSFIKLAIGRVQAQRNGIPLVEALSMSHYTHMFLERYERGTVRVGSCEANVCQCATEKHSCWRVRGRKCEGKEGRAENLILASTGKGAILRMRTPLTSMWRQQRHYGNSNFRLRAWPKMAEWWMKLQ